MTAILALVLHAHAFAPSDAVYTQAEPNRIFRVHRPAQNALRHQPGWTEFVNAEGRGWDARFDERTGSAHRAWGPGLNLGAVRTEAEVRAAMERFFARNAGVIGVPARSLRFKRAEYVARTDTWYVDYDRLVSGVPIWRGGVTARFRFGKLVLFGADTYPDAVLPQAELTAEEAIVAAELDGPAGFGVHTNESASLVGLPLDVPGGVRLHLAWLVRSETTAPLGRWQSFVDAETGELLAVSNDIKFLDGTVYGTHPRRTLDGDNVTTALPYVHVVGDSSDYADVDGLFSVTGDSATTYLAGSYLTVVNVAGAEGQLAVSDSAPVWTTENATLAEIASYAFVHQVAAWAKVIAPEVRMSTTSLSSNVNSSQYSCNAYYDGNLNFFVTADGCNNSAQIADVNYHEWGHGFHAYSAQKGVIDGSLGEGTGDTVAFLMTHDSEIAPWFQTNGGGIRDVSPNHSYPDDVTGEVHEDGLIFGGAVWDVWGQLLKTYGEDRADEGDAWSVTAHLFADALKAGPTIEESYDEFVVADDDDGDLSNGTPHFCEIAEGFADHGLGPLVDAGGALSMDHQSLSNQSSGEGISVSGTVVNIAEACSPFTLQSAALHYSLDDGATWDSVPASVSGDNLSATFPSIPHGTIVWYYLEGDGVAGSSTTAPSDGAIAPYSFYVGELTEVYCADFSDDGGYTHELLDGTDREGADDWTWDNPEGMASDPDSAYTGKKVWGNDLGGGNYNGDYQPDVTNRLTTPPIEVGDAAEVIVQYRRWLNVEDGYYDHATVYADDTPIWVNHESSKQVGDENTADDEWVLASHRVAVTNGALTLAWEIDSDQGFETSGWTLDDVCVYTPAASDSVFSVKDFVASDDQTGVVSLSWTQPNVAGDTSAVVIRRDDRFGTSATDGTVVYTGSALVPGEPVSAEDPFVGHGYYTVIVGGDAGFAEGAVEGGNADEGTGLGDGAGSTVDLTAGGGCNCESGAGGAGFIGLVAVGAALGRRRR